MSADQAIQEIDRIEGCQNFKDSTRINLIRCILKRQAPYLQQESDLRRMTAILIFMSSRTTTTSATVAALAKKLLKLAVPPRKEPHEQELRPLRPSIFSKCMHILTQKTPFIHGGGDSVAKAFFESRFNGYAAENQQQGIFVAPNDNKQNRDQFYALRTPILFFQTPCIVTGEVPSRYLKVVNSNGNRLCNREFVLSPEGVPFVTRLKYRRITAQTLSSGEIRQWLEEVLPPVQMTELWKPDPTRMLQGITEDLPPQCVNEITRLVRSYYCTG
jgi:hypothetical protein